MENQQLPDEILFLIFKYLHIADLLKCRQVRASVVLKARLGLYIRTQLCSSIRKLIDEDVTIQYRLSLVLSNMEDGPPGSTPTAERLERLHKHQAAWSSLDWEDTEDRIEIPDIRCFEMSGK
jgi:hypothetical protein